MSFTGSGQDEGDAGQSQQARAGLSGSHLESRLVEVESRSKVSARPMDSDLDNTATHAKKLIPKTSRRLDRTDPRRDIWTKRSWSAMSAMSAVVDRLSARPHSLCMRAAIATISSTALPKLRTCELCG